MKKIYKAKGITLHVGNDLEKLSPQAKGSIRKALLNLIEAGEKAAAPKNE